LPDADKQQAAVEQNATGTAQAPTTGEIIGNEDKEVQQSLEENFSKMGMVTAHLSNAPSMDLYILSF
jgi:hypothetical protein